MKSTSLTFALAILCSVGFSQNKFYTRDTGNNPIRKLAQDVTGNCLNENGYSLYWNVLPLISDNTESNTIKAFYSNKKDCKELKDNVFKANKKMTIKVLSQSDMVYTFELVETNFFDKNPPDISTVGQEKAGFVNSGYNFSLLQDLLNELGQFDTDYDGKAFCYEQDFKADINNLKRNIATVLGIDVDSSSLALEANLKVRYDYVNLSNADKATFDGFVNPIKTIYRAVMKKENIYRYQIIRKHVPNSDEMTLKLNRLNASPIEQSHFVKGGFKIDFGAGIFYHSINNPEFKFRSATYRYYADSTASNVNDPNQTDSFTVVREKEGKVVLGENQMPNIALGTMIHMYSRITQVVGIGGSVGFMADLNKNILGMFGASFHFRSNKDFRCSIITGFVIGQQTVLSSTMEETSKDDFNNDEIRTSESAVPKMYKDDNVDTRKKMGAGFFAGMTFNFPSSK